MMATLVINKTRSRIERLAKAGMTDDQIAAITGYARSTVEWNRSKLGLKKQNPSGYRPTGPRLEPSPPPPIDKPNVIDQAVAGFGGRAWKQGDAFYLDGKPMVFQDLVRAYNAECFRAGKEQIGPAHLHCLR